MTDATSIYEAGLERRQANFTALSPLSFIRRSARVYPEHIALVHGPLRQTWTDTYRRCRQLASALTQRGIGSGDTVAIMSPNVPAMYEAHFGVPMAGAILNTLNIRLDADTLSFILDHGEAKALITDGEFSDVMRKALTKAGRDLLVIDIDDPLGPPDRNIGQITYEALLDEGDPEFDWMPPEDEWQAISLNYTSGTTGNPKGVVYHHRGAYLNAISNIIGWEMAHHPVYLWTLPMFHCNGWCFPWALAAVAGTSVCLRKTEAGPIYDAIAEDGITHFCGAPVVLGMLINAPDEDKRPFEQTVRVMTAASPPPAAVLAAMEAAGFRVTHVYGLTETYGPAVICSWHESWNALSADQRAEKNSRQGVPYHVLDQLEIMNPDTMTPVAANGETMGEAMFRGNNVMKGYLKNPTATDEAFAGGWFHSGDLGVMHRDHYVQLKDRSKDIIISGGENISSIEVEDTLYRHPGVLEAAVVAQPDDKWGETPCAFVTLKNDVTDVTEDDVIAAVNTWHTSRPLERSFSARCPKPVLVRFRNSSCATLP